MNQAANPGATLVAPIHAFDADALAAYLRTHVAPFHGSIQVEQFQGGQSNPTYRIVAGDRRYIVRRKPPGALLPSAHAIDREHRVMAALAETEVPVPAMLALCEDPQVIGTAFYVMDYVDGRILWDPAMPGMTPAMRAAHFDELNRVLAALHAVDYEAAGLADFGRPGAYVTRQIARWTKQYEAGVAGPIASMDRLIRWLPGNVPAEDPTSIVHGDYRVDNVVFHPTEPRILAVLDWELATLGHPLSDFAYHAMAWRLSAGEFRGIRGADLAALGIPSEDDYIAAYCRRTGRASIAHWEFYLVFSMFRIAAILHGVHSRALGGNAASRDAVETGGRAVAVADVAWRTVERMT